MHNFVTMPIWPKQEYVQFIGFDMELYNTRKYATYVTSHST